MTTLVRVVGDKGEVYFFANHSTVVGYLYLYELIPWFLNRAKLATYYKLLHLGDQHLVPGNQPSFWFCSWEVRVLLKILLPDNLPSTKFFELLPGRYIFLQWVLLHFCYSFQSKLIDTGLVKKLVQLYTKPTSISMSQREYLLCLISCIVIVFSLLVSLVLQSYRKLKRFTFSAPSCFPA